MNLAEITIAYGMTETSPVSLPEQAPTTRWTRRVTTVGRVQPHVEAKVVDADGRIVPVGTPGELWTRGYLVMLGYWGDEATTRRGGGRGRLDAHRRPGDDRRRGLLQHRRPGEGHADPRRREHLPARDRGIPVPPPEGAVACRWSACPIRNTARRSAPGSCCARGEAGDRRGDPDLLPRPDRPLQDPAPHPLRHRDAR